MKHSWHWLLLIAALALVAWFSYDYYATAGQYGADARLWTPSVKSSIADEAKFAYTQMLQARMRLIGGLVAAGLCVGALLWSRSRIRQ